MSPSRPRSGFTGPTHQKGRHAEDEAARWIEAQGCRILARNVESEAGEIDLVLLDGDTLCFVEVKARAGHQFGYSIEAVDSRKQRRLARAASLYLVRHPHSGPCRFDVLGLDPGAEGWAFTWIRDAFRL